MAEKRMFTKKITESDAFLDMPMSAQCLYFHLNMNADDDGFVNNPKTIKRNVGASDDDLKILLAKRFVLAFESGVIVIKHWRMHNTLKSDRYKMTDYQEEMAQLQLKPNKAYTVGNTLEPVWNQFGTSLEPISRDLEPQNSIDKNRLDKNSIDNKRFVPPTLEEVQGYCLERGNGIDPEAFIDYYASQKWKKSNGQPLTDWKAAVRTWEKRDKERQQRKETQFTAGVNRRAYDFNALESKLYGV